VSPVIKPPVILSPRNGDVFESPHGENHQQQQQQHVCINHHNNNMCPGSDLELSCTVLAECHMVDDTVVTWLANNQSVESSYLHGRALQGGRR